MRLTSTRCEASPPRNNGPPTNSRPGFAQLAPKTTDRWFIAGALGQRDIRHPQAAGGSAPLQRQLAEDGGLDVTRARIEDLLPGHDTVVVLVDEHIPDDVVNGQVPADFHGAVGPRRSNQQIAGAGGMRERGLHPAERDEPEEKEWKQTSHGLTLTARPRWRESLP